MQTKNLLLAIALSLAVMFGWTYFSQMMGWTPSPEQLAQQQAEYQKQQAELAAAQKAQIEQGAGTTSPIPLSTFTPADGKDVIVETPLYKAVFYTGGGILRSFELKKYAATPKKEPLFTILGLGIGSKEMQPRGDAPQLTELISPAAAAVAPMGLLINGQPSWSTGKWAFKGENISLESGEKTLEFEGEVDGVRVIRSITFFADTYEIKESVRIAAQGDQARSVRLGYTVAEDSTFSGGGYYDAVRVAWGMEGQYDEEADADTLTKPGLQNTGNFSWAAASSTYFMSAIAPVNTNGLTLKAMLQNGIYRVMLEQTEIVVQPKAQVQQDVVYWIGPKVAKLLEKAPNDLINAIDLGMFGIIGSILLWCLEYMYVYANNWGVAIILLTIGIKILFWPLTAKSYASMAKMRKLQPMMQAIREKHGEDREALSRETMALYKTYGVNPASGCVPMLVQLPVFFGLYQALLTSIELRGASFITYLPGTDMLWLADLSQADPFLITPIIMGISMFAMQKMSPPMGDPMQQKIMMFLPVIFTVMFLSFPAGLVLYWLVNNLLSMLQQWLLLRKVDQQTNASATPAPKGTSTK